MNRDQYKEIKAENFSNIKRILESPAAYIAGEPEREDETALYVGTLVHAMVLEGKNLLDLFAVKPAGMRFSTKEGMVWKAAQTLPIITEEESKMVPAIAEAIAKDPNASTLIRMCPERERLVEGEIQGVKFKGILDGFGKDKSGRYMHLDLKTTTSAYPYDFEKQIRERHYDLQAEIYSALIAMEFGVEYHPKSAWIVVEKKQPYEVACYFPTEEMIECGTMKLQACIDRLKSCRENNKWPKALSQLSPIEPSIYSVSAARKLLESTF